MWAKWSNLLQPLTALMSKKIKFKQTHVEKKAFGEIKRISTSDALLIYPDLNKHSDIHMDVNELQVVSVINQDVKPIAFYSRKLTGPQQWYTVTENEFLGIVETLK